MINYLSEADSKALRGIALLRLDFNTADSWRIKAGIPTIKRLMRHASHIVVVSHRGRPHGAEKKFSLRSDAGKLADYLKRPVSFIASFDANGIRTRVERSPKGSIFLLENIRFQEGEMENDPILAKQLASIGDIYVNDAFAVSHRANASVSAITKYLPSFAGLEFEQEMTMLSRVMTHGKHPLVVIIGGAKAEDKIGVMRYFKSRANRFLLGGATANTLLAMKGVDIKKSLAVRDEKELKSLQSIVHYPHVVLPIDWQMENGKILDIGPKTEEFFAKEIKRARTIIWNGPMGFTEKKKFAKGSLAIAKAIIANKRAFRLVGGGETVGFFYEYKLEKKFDFVSTGGGAMLDFLSGETLPGIRALESVGKNSRNRSRNRNSDNR
jgi:phosphoglycerate kinase